MCLFELLQGEYRKLDPQVQQTAKKALSKIAVWKPKQLLEKDHSLRETAVERTYELLFNYRNHIIERQLLEFIVTDNVTYHTVLNLATRLHLEKHKLDEFAQQFKLSKTYLMLVELVLKKALQGSTTLLDNLLTKSTKITPKDLIERATKPFMQHKATLNDIFTYIGSLDFDTIDVNALIALANAKDPTPTEAKYVLEKKWLNSVYSEQIRKSIDNILGLINGITLPKKDGQQQTPFEQEMQYFKNAILKANGDETEAKRVCRTTLYRLYNNYGVK